MEPVTTEGASSPLVLVVDDDNDIRDILSYGIKASGCRCLTAESAEAALKIL
ncbi:MAG: DNA-binding response regulator, partial [Desulfosarcina sp.]|nr:DNA-binding response regulator [Desulfosarcina sp.]MBC2768197.1 DNA-binding response regulator [Desulfosarcina sp.]